MIYKNIALYGLFVQACTGTFPVEARNLKKGSIKNNCDPDSKAKFAVPILNKDPNKMKTCKKLLKRKKYREALCQITEVQENCQSTCATCEMVIDPSVCEDTTLKFFAHDSVVETKKPRKKDCDWYVGKGYCDSSDTVKSMCPVSCDTCPSESPSLSPSLSPSGTPSAKPSQSPSQVPSLQPSLEPSEVPSLVPSQVPSLQPSIEPSEVPSLVPSQVPSLLSCVGEKFQTTDELKAEAQAFCSDPAAYNITKYGNATCWNVEDITDMTNVFSGTVVAAGRCNPDVSNWNVSKVTNFRNMFSYAFAFDQDLSSWNVSNGQDFYAMFNFASLFNQDIGSWNVSKGTNFDSMFAQATSFDQDLGSWNVSNGQDFDYMFNGASAFNQDLCAWTSNSNVSSASSFCQSCLAGC